MNKPMPPCGIADKCSKRSSDCHSHCIDYLFYQAKNEVRSEAIRKAKEVRQAPVERGVKISNKINKRKGRRQH